ncbi:hypothetical protein BH20CHL1_BH20CHL1_04090 [soil metagenome]|nr:hypothetical protein [Chloroflexia bacterium]
MLAFTATLRLPSRTPSVRRASRVRTILTVGFASLVFASLPLRIILAVAGISQWTTSWRVVKLVTTPFVAPFEMIAPFQRTLLGNVTIAELLATGAFGLLSVYLLALLTVRRKR